MNEKKIVNLGEAMSAVEVVDMMIGKAIAVQASDIHIEPLDELLRVRFRVDGILREYFSFSAKMQAMLVSRLKVMAGLDIVEKRLPQDGRIPYVKGGGSVDLRIAVIPTVMGEKVVIRVLQKEKLPATIDALGFSMENLRLYEAMCKKSHGMILLTGTTGSGKTTTLYTTLKRMNTMERNIITIENPVEYRLDGINQIQISEKIGLDFAVCLRAVLRQDPDVIMIGEIRDRETADIAVRAALTGHLIFSTLHTADAAGAVFRLIDMGVPPFLLASSLIGVIAQRLVRVICPYCKKQYHAQPDTAEWRFFGKQDVALFEGGGCSHCGSTGYSGRTVLSEMIEVDKQMRQEIFLHGDKQTWQRFFGKPHGNSMYEDGIKKVLQGITTLEEVMKVVAGDYGQSSGMERIAAGSD